ncbi:Prolipoprotein diacylglyceryl transferase [Clostridiaceae bacterium JG1575]|nr:Prolipoprotein diacylglyceryl transferase [Clostridiaceae bacterium JG1575]
MNRVAFRIFGLDIMWYAILIMTGVLIALGVSRFTTSRKGFNLSYDHLLDAFVYAFPLALVGARIYYVIFEWNQYQGDFLKMLDIRSGGLAIHGGLIGAFIGVLIYKAVHKRTTHYMLNLADAAMPGIIIAQAVGRWGNFVNQEAYGGPVSQEFINRFPAFIQQGMLINGQYHHPTFLYESLWNLLIFAVLLMLFLKRKPYREGTIIAWYMILYSIGRFFIEGLRTDSLYIGSLRQAQVISLVWIALGVIYLIYKYTRPIPASPLNASEEDPTPPPQEG